MEKSKRGITSRLSRLLLMFAPSARLNIGSYAFLGEPVLPECLKNQHIKK